MNWLTESWWSLLGGAPAAISLTFFALLSGALIGAEREKHEKAAGMRTLILVCLGSAVFTMVGFVFTSHTGDSGRVAAQIVTGIGFLGAGVILHERRIVSGATTAATIWVTASIGMVVGAGYGPAALGLSLLVRTVLGSVRFFEMRFIEHVQPLLLRVVFQPKQGKVRARILRILADFNVVETVCQWAAPDESTHTLTVVLRLAHRQLREMIDEIAALPEVASIDESPAP
jgi:putative Mg2+ transporter-C (MgtC) family protein